MTSAIYAGRVTHTRRGPSRHHFSYPIHMFYVDLDELDRLPRGVFRVGRFGVLSFCRADYLGPAAVPLKTAVLDRVEAQLGLRPSGPVRVLTQVRNFGYVFNPVSIYYCFGPDGRTLEAVVAEITNTPWKERHAYVLPASRGVVRSDFAKQFHVSPFFAMAQQYRWNLAAPDETLTVAMVNEEAGRPVFSATLALDRRDFSTASVWRAAIRQPLMAWRVHLGIYIQAYRLWRKRTPYFEHPAKAVVAGRRRT
ncbi:MAG: DUF1365 domain-containing protein [Acidobacteria bacterium]|nr:DUF1365 domain-containing protein [Acidobacteriota bacterium]